MKKDSDLELGEINQPIKPSESEVNMSQNTIMKYLALG
jgi:hypothetical protein